MQMAENQHAVNRSYPESWKSDLLSSAKGGRVQNHPWQIHPRLNNSSIAVNKLMPSSEHEDRRASGDRYVAGEVTWLAYIVYTSRKQRKLFSSMQ